MDPLRCSSRVLKISQEDIDFTCNEHEHQRNKFNVTLPPISRPPSSCGNRLTKIQKIEPKKHRKRQKWNDRFHIDANEEKIFQPNPTPIYKPKKLPRKQLNTYSKIHHNISEKRKSKPKSSIIPPFDVVTGKRQWGKRNKKRAKWSTVKNKSIHNNILLNKNRKPKRAKWNKPSQINVNVSNPLTKSQSRVIPLIPKVAKSQSESVTELHIKSCNKTVTEKKDENLEDLNVKLNDNQKKEFAELFSNVLQTVINKDEKNKIQTKCMGVNTEKINNKIQTEKKDINDEFDNIESKSEFYEEYTTKTDSLNVQRNCNDYKKNNKRATRRILPVSVTHRNKELIEQRKQYLEPLQKVADIIFDDLIQDISEELNEFCCEVVDALIHSETNMTNC
eukprot:245900_1